MQAILYTRVSTNSQGNESLNIQNQLCLSYLNSQGITLSGSFSEIGSAYNGKQNILNNILTNNYNCWVYIFNVSRFSRNIMKGIEMIKLANQRKINIHFIEENLDTSNPNHTHQIRVKISEAQLESETLSARQLNRNKILKEQGWRFGNPKYGKSAKVTLGKRKFVPNKEEKNVIDFIVQARTGTSCRQLNNKLRKIDSSADPIHFYDSDGVTRINYFDTKNTLSYQEIADLLNDYDINKRGKDWTGSSVSHVFHENTSLENKLGDLNLTI